MRYILNDEGYIETISFNNEITCNDKSCTEYTGTIPEGYSSLVEWNENAVIQAYHLVDGNLTYDADKETELLSKWEEESTGDFSSKVTLNETPSSIHFYKKNGIVCIAYQGESKTHAVGDVLFTLPEGYRPRVPEGKNQFFIPFVKNNIAYGVCWIRVSDGECVLGQISSTSGTGRIYFTTSYVCQ